MSKKEKAQTYDLAPEPEVKKVGPRAAILALIAICLVMAAMSHFTNRQLKRSEQFEPPVVTPPPIDPEQLRQAAETSHRLKGLRQALAEREAAKRAVTPMPDEWFHPPQQRRPTPAAQRGSRSLHPAGFTAHAEAYLPAPAREPARGAPLENETTQVLRDWTRELRAMTDPTAAQPPPEAPRPAPRYEPQRAELHPPPSPYLLRAGTTLDAVLQSRVHSEMPGQVIAQVADDVYDSRRGRHLLIPAGSLLLGRLEQGAVFGEQRVQIAWERLQYPGGRTVVLTGLPTADGSGAAGVHDRVDNHWGRLYGHAFLTSLVGAAGQLSQPQRSGFQAPSFGQEAAGAIGRDLAQVTERVLERNLEVRPTLEIRPGFLLHVVLTEDYFFEQPYRSPPIG